jgi:class 3 adenylate cyclase
MNIQEFCNKLENAEARSESVIAVFCDIRGFSNFSRDVESSDTSNFLKHFYLKLLRKYFQKAAFAKPAGDGMLMIFSHNEKTLNEASRLVLSKCFQVLKDFPKMFKSTPIINYTTPDAIGFGIARGSASYLIANDEILDYSGKLLNLTARLNEYARPSGIVIDGNYQYEAIPKRYRKIFEKKSVYVRGIAEEKPIEIFYSKGIFISDAALHPINEHKWKLATQRQTVSEVLALEGTYSVYLSEPVLSQDKITAEFWWPHSHLADKAVTRASQRHTYNVDASGHSVLFDTREAKEIITQEKLSNESVFQFRVHYVPKPRGSEKTKGSSRSIKK